MDWILCEDPGTPLWCLQPMEKCMQTRKHKFSFTILIFSWLCNYSKKRLLFYRLDNSANTTDILMSGSAVKNHGWPKNGRQLYAKRTTSLSTSSGSNSSSTSTSQDLSSTSPAQERSDELAPREWCGSPSKTQNKNKKRDANRDSDNRSIIWYLSWVWIDRGRTLERRYSDCGFGIFGKVGRIRHWSSKNQRERSIDISRRRWIHFPSSRRYSKIVRKRPRFPRTHTEAGTNRKERRFSMEHFKVTGGSECPLTDQSSRLARWLSITLSLRKTGQDSTNLVRKCYLEYSSDMHWSRGEFGKEILWLQTLRSWKNSKTQFKRSVDATKAWQFYIPSRRWNSKIVWKKTRIPRTHSKAGTTCKEWRSQRRTSRRTRRVSTDRIKRWRRSQKRLLVHPRWLHLSSSHWTSTSTLRAERRNIPDSTETHWRLQSYLYKSGRFARKTSLMTTGPWTWIEVCQNLGKDSRSSFYWKKTLPRDTCGPGRDQQKFKQLSNLIICGLKFGLAWEEQLRRKARMGERKTKARQRSKTERHLFHRSGRWRIQRKSIKHARKKLEVPMEAAIQGIYVVRREIDKSSNGYQTRSCMTRSMDENK